MNQASLPEWLRRLHKLNGTALVRPGLFVRAEPALSFVQRFPLIDDAAK